MTIKGIDISQYQGNIDFAKVKAAGVMFAIIRAGFGKYTSQKDPYFEQNYKNAKAAGLDVGVYWYSYATSTADAIAEAKACMTIISGKKFEYPIFFDLEEKAQFVRGKSFCDSLVKAFCGELEKCGYFAGLYISRSPLQSYISNDVARRYTLWVAEYASKLNYSGTYAMWQYTSSGKVNGISGNVDCDYCYVDYPNTIKSGGYNGYKKQESGEKVLDTSGAKKGDKSLGILSYKQLLLIAYAKKIVSVKVNNDNVFGDGTEKATNELLKRLGYKQNGIAGSRLVKALGEMLMK
jgi:GH25 family lysozyme M1 (1,4-beta-N-acetylmuramidase)